MTVDTEVLLGREGELAAAGRFLATIEEHAAGLVLEGEPGIGKTVLVGHAVEEARRRGYRVLAAAPTHTESSLSFVGLTDLLADAHELFAGLPSPQRAALEVALLLREPTAAPPDRRAIGMGLLGVLRALAASSPVVVAIDDLQWLDRPSAGALSFALRRVMDEPIGLLTAIRTGSDSVAAESIGSGRAERVVLGPLNVGAVHALLGERLQLSMPRSVLLRIHEACRGNPLFALELGRALQERGLPEPGRPFEIPADVVALFAARLEQFPDDTLDALGVASATAAPTVSLVTAASTGALDSAVRADVIRLEGERIHFTHPLLSSAVYARFEPSARRELHRRLAAVTDREERARHLALAADKPDADVAAALDEAAEQAAGRGAPAAAATLAELAVKLTPVGDVDRLHTRSRLAGEWHYLAGDTGRARVILDQLVDELPPGAERARALLLLAEAHSGRLSTMLPLREHAVAEAADDDRVLAVALRELGGTLFVWGDPGRGLACVREALAAAERTGDARLLVPSLSFLAWSEIRTDHVTPNLLERAFALEQEAGYLRPYENPSTVEGLRLMMLEDDLDAARVRLTDAAASARDHGDDDARAILLFHLTELEGRAGRYDDALRCATEAHELREQFGLGTGASLCWLALAQALRGNHDAARAAAERGHAECEKEGYELFAVRNLRVLGLLALSAGDASSAARILAPLPERLARRGYGPVTVLQVLPDAIEALIAVGDLDAAAARLAELDRIAAECGIASAHARAARCRGLLAGAERNFGDAFGAFENALVAHQRLPDPLERGRTLLALGQTRRRAGHRREAGRRLREALAMFDELGAASWAGQARAELARLGGRTASGDALTGAEERVARLVAEGKTNREVAAALFVTESTVETHLSSIYRKLDLRSRTELAGWLAGQTS